MKRTKHHPELSKLRSDAFWNTLTPAQREQLEHWLFEENLSYTDTHARAQNELGLACSRSTIARIYKRGAKLRTLADLADAQDFAQDLLKSGASAEDLRAANVKLILARLQAKLLAGADVKEVAALGRLMLQEETREIQRERAALAREKFQHRAAAAALAAAPLASELKVEDEERAREAGHRAMERLFGVEALSRFKFPPGEVHPWAKYAKPEPAPEVEPASDTSETPAPAAEPVSPATEAVSPCVT